MGFVHSTSFAPELLYPGLAKIWGQEYKALTPTYTRYYEVRPTKQRFEKEQGITGFRTASVKDEGDSVSYGQMYQGYQKEYVQLTYALGAIVTREMIDYDQYNTIAKIPRLLAEAGRRTEETVAADVINNGFDSSYTGADGQPLFSTSHPLVGGGTQANKPTTDADLSETALEDAFIQIFNFRDGQNQRIDAYPVTLLVPRSNYFNAHKILKTQYKLSSADNDINQIANEGLEVVVNRYLTDQDAWYLITDVPDGFTMYVSRPAEIQRDNDFDTDNLKIKMSSAYAVGFTDWRCAYGSSGA